MRKGISLAIWLFALSVNSVALFVLSAFNKLAIIQGWAVAEKGNQKEEEMEKLVSNISDLAAKVLKIFGEQSLSCYSLEAETFSISEPIAAKSSNQSVGDGGQTYFVSFLLRDRKNKTTPSLDGTPKQRMVISLT